MKTFSERLKEALEIKNIKQNELAKRTGLDKSLISNYISGRYRPKAENLFNIAEVLDVPVLWLLGCDVPMENINLQLENLSPKETQLIIKYRANPQMQEAVNKLLGVE